jgi:hypothetical protein
MHSERFRRRHTADHHHHRPHVWHHHSPSQVALLVISIACAPTRRTSQPAKNASFPAARSKKPCVRPDPDIVLFNLSLMLTLRTVAQRWQQKACKAPFRNTGPVTQRVGIALVTIAGVCVALRFLARWRIKDSTVGWDDWTILLSFILLIPSTIMLANSMSSRLGVQWSAVLTFTSSGQQWHGSRHLDCPVR